MSIIHNISALNTYRQLNGSRTSANKNMERLSSGMKINRAGDDAAGLAISEKMKAQIRGLDTAHRNIQDGISLIQTAEGGMGSVHENLHRMRELVVQGANGTLAADDRESIQRELDQCKAEIQRVADTTEFNGKKLLDGSLSRNGVVSSSLPPSSPPVPVLSAFPKTLGGSDNDYFGSLKHTADGGYIIASGTNSNDGDVSGNHGMMDIWLTKMDAAGVIQWKKCLGGSFDDYVWQKSIDIQQTSDGGYILSCPTLSDDGDVSGNHGFGDLLVIKLDPSGSIQWTHALGGSAEEWTGTSVQQTSDGYIVACSTNSNDGDVSGYHGSGDIWLTKLDNSGSLMWQKCLGTDSVLEQKPTIRKSSDGGFILLGEKQDGYANSWVVKMDNSGDIQWQKTIGAHFTTGQKWAGDIQSTSDGGYILTTLGLLYSAYVTKMNKDGDTEWNKYLGDGGLDSIQQTKDGGYILSGFTNSAIDTEGNVIKNQGGYDIWAVKLDSSGAVVWQNTFGGSGDDGLYDWGSFGTSDYGTNIVETANGFVLAATTESNDGDISGNHGKNDIWVAMLDSSGNLVSSFSDPSGSSDPSDHSKPTNVSGLNLQVGANTGQSFQVFIDSMTTKALGLIDGWPRVDPPDDAQTSLGMIDQAIQLVSTGRAKLGAIYNALEHIMNNVSNASLNLSAAESRIRDADMAKEMMDFSKQQVLIEAGTAMLAQANQQPQNVLSLLKSK